MHNAQTAFTLVNPQSGNLAFKLFSFDDDNNFDHLQRHNYYTIVWVTNGSGKLKTDFSEYVFDADTMFTFSLYQPFMITTDEKIEGVVLNFHPDFFCIYKHHKEVACNGILFNNIYEPPFIKVDEKSVDTFKMLLEQLRTELQNPALAQYEILVSYLKIFLITAARLKTDQHHAGQAATNEVKEPFILQNLKDAIEEHFKKKHSASDYAGMLNISAKALAKLSKTHFNKTLTDLIAERIVIEAKRELYLTNKPVKEIAFELGYNDEYYFSRFFKTNADVSPQLFRDTVGMGRGGEA
jgi:AraC family transcriptional activator of pobA